MRGARAFASNRAPEATRIAGACGTPAAGRSVRVSFKPEPVDHDGNVLVDSTRDFLAKYVDNFVKPVGQIARD